VLTIPLASDCFKKQLHAWPIGLSPFELNTSLQVAFKTPTPRDIELTSPYMHDGSFRTLIDVVRSYNRGSNPNSQLNERMHPLNLTDRELNDLVEFMRALTSDDVLKLCQTTKPQNRNPGTFTKLISGR